MAKNELSLPASELHELFSLDVESGVLRWKSRPAHMFKQESIRTPEHSANIWNSRYAGTVALNCVGTSGHLLGRINDKSFFAHRVVFALVHGRWPADFIDHINGDPTDNRPCNLRDVSHEENHKNQSMRKNNTSGVIGVGWNKRLSKWQAHIMVQGKSKHLGFFESINLAISARKGAEELFKFHKNHGRKAA